MLTLVLKLNQDHQDISLYYYLFYQLRSLKTFISLLIILLSLCVISGMTSVIIISRLRFGLGSSDVLLGLRNSSANSVTAIIVGSGACEMGTGTGSGAGSMVGVGVGVVLGMNRDVGESVAQDSDNCILDFL